MMELLKTSLRQHLRLYRKYNHMRRVYRKALPGCPARRSGRRCCSTNRRPVSEAMSFADADAPAGPPTGEVAVLVDVQSRLANPQTIAVARGMSHFGEHAAGWVALSAPARCWIAGTAGLGARRCVGAVAAHAAAIAIKLVVRRRRLHHPTSPSTSALPAR